MAMSRREWTAAAVSTVLGGFGIYQGASWLSLDEVGVGVIGCGDRGSQLLEAFDSLSRVNIVGLCDPDEQRLNQVGQNFKRARRTRDLRELLQWSDVDAVVIATCNHWHCLAALWALDAGKHVYVEKPMSHNVWEGQQLVAAAKAGDRVVQVGMQHRSQSMQAELRAFLHQRRELGAVQAVRANVVKKRLPIGLRETPLELPESIDAELWYGPAEKHEIRRKSLHYDWHWNWQTGDGEMGNWGVHVIDDIRNIVFEDQVQYPTNVTCGGGRVLWNDAGQTPNVQLALFEAGPIPVAFGLTDLLGEGEQPVWKQYAGPKGAGYIVYCEGGTLSAKRGKAVARDLDGNTIREFESRLGSVHQAEFVDAIRNNNPKGVSAPPDQGHWSASWCHLANASYACGVEGQAEPITDDGVWPALLEEYGTHLQSLGVDLKSPSIVMSEQLDCRDGTLRKDLLSNEVAARVLRNEGRGEFSIPCTDCP